MPPTNFTLENANKFHHSVRRKILQERWIDTANGGMEDPATVALFDLYMEWIDGSQFDDISCGKCRMYVINQYKEMQPYFVTMENELRNKL